MPATKEITLPKLYAICFPSDKSFSLAVSLSKDSNTDNNLLFKRNNTISTNTNTQTNIISLIIPIICATSAITIYLLIITYLL